MTELRQRVDALSDEERLTLARRLRERQTASGAAPERPLDFSVFYFADSAVSHAEGYEFLFSTAALADKLGFEAIWTPERHFHSFGGLYPSPAVLGAALAARTARIRLHAGSVVLPLHHPVRVCEEWALLDNLSGGRVGISFASGWHQRDFVLATEPYERRRQTMFERMEIVDRLWRGEDVELTTPDGLRVTPTISPRPVQPRLPMWVTSSGRPETFAEAGRAGTNVLAALIGHSVDELAAKIALYRKAREQGGHDRGRATVMLHTYLDDSERSARGRTREPLKEYLAGYLRQQRDMAFGDDSDRHLELQLDYAYERYVSSAALIGTPSTVEPLLRRLISADVDEVACLIDFGVDLPAARSGLLLLSEVRDRFGTAPAT